MYELFVAEEGEGFCGGFLVHGIVNCSADVPAMVQIAAAHSPVCTTR
jgi:hypothetical protein